MAETETTTDQQSLVAALERVVPRYQAALRRAVEQAEGDDRLTMRQFRFLQAIAGMEGGALTTGLARTLHLAVPTVTRMLDGLAERGLIERHPDPESRRQTLVLPTAAGLAVLARYEAIIAARLHVLLAPLEPECTHRLAAALADLEAALDAAEEGGR